jgi:Uma2 family endonuclease
VGAAPYGVLGHPGPWIIADVEALPDLGDHARYEILSPGVLTVGPAPGTVHQRASRLLANLLDAAARRQGADVDVLEAVNVELPGERLTMPDIVVVDGPVADSDPVRYPPSAVRLVVEIVSPGSKAVDRAIKPDLYAEAGIPGFWRLELQPAPHLIAYTLSEGQYAQTATLQAGQRGTLMARSRSTSTPPR